MNVLVINCGSSSLKYQLIDTDTEKLLEKGICERISGSGSNLSRKPAGRDEIVIEKELPDHKAAVSLVLSQLTDPDTGVIDDLKLIDAVGHRVVHGGEKFSSAVIIDSEVEKGIEECADLAPLHNPANLTGIRACKSLMPGVPQVAVFDTAFHQTMPRQAYLYALPYEYYEKYKIRRYGFHGTSHSYVSKRLAKFLGLDINHSRLIVCHLGNGASVSAIKDGKSIDTSMGLTPLEGLMMGTRSGDLDPAIVEYIGNKENLTASEVVTVLNKKSGLLGLSGLSSDFRDCAEAAKAGNTQADDALDVYAYRVSKYIGAYVAALGGVDGIALTAGAGENNSEVRLRIMKRLGFLGITMDSEKNKLRGEEFLLSTEDSRVPVCVIPTNEELAIARETAELVK